MAPSSKTGIWNSSDFVYLLLKGSLHLNMFPIDVKWNFDFTPVNFAAKSIVYLSVLNPKSSLGQTLHVQNDQPMISSKELLKYMKEIPQCSKVEEKIKSKVDLL